MAKDVVTFLNWAAEPEHDERKKVGIKAVILFSTLFALSLYTKRFKWTPIKNRKIGEFTYLLRVIGRFADACCSLRPAGGWQALDVVEYILPVVELPMALAERAPWTSM